MKRLSADYWTADRIDAEIRILAASGRVLKSADVRRRNPGLHAAALKEYRSWRKAMCAAGLDPEHYRPQSEWTEKRIRKALLEWEAKAGPLKPSHLNKHARGLYIATLARYGTLEAACRKFGVQCCPMKLRWSREKVLEEIKRRHAQGLSLNSTEVRREKSALGSAAFKLFGSWPAALAEAGINYDDFHRRRIWNKPRIAEALRSWSRLHGTLSQARLWKSDPALLAAASRHYGSLQSAAQSNGMPFVARPEPWSFDRIFKEIRELKRQGHSLAQTHVRKVAWGLVQAVHKRRLTWEEAVESAGIKFDRYRKLRRWNPQRFESELRKWVKEHGALSPGRLRATDGGLLHAAGKRFGSLAAAARQFRLPYQTLREEWDAEKVIAEILQRLRSSQSLQTRVVMQEAPGLYKAAGRRLGSWKEALAKAGVDYERHLRRKDRSSEKVEQDLKEWVARHGVLSNKALRKTDYALLRATQRRFGTVGRAARALGLPAGSSSNKWSERKVLSELRKLLKATPALKPSDVWKADRKLYWAAARRFGSCREAIGLVRSRSPAQR